MIDNPPHVTVLVISLGIPNKLSQCHKSLNSRVEFHIMICAKRTNGTN